LVLVIGRGPSDERPIVGPTRPTRERDGYYTIKAKGDEAMEPSNTQQEATMEAKPQKEHQWLQKLVGEWEFEGKAAMGPGQPPAKFTGTESVRSLGGLWFLGEGQGETPGGGAATTMLMLGYDPQKNRYVGTWIGSMMTHL
jgi:hypothetical protein